MRYHSRSHARGTASVEAVVALPVFVVLFVGMFFVRDLTSARLRADQEVRRCSWEYALNNNCEHPPRGCEHVVGTGHYGSLLPQGLDGTISDLGRANDGTHAKSYARVKRVIESFVAQYVAEAITKRFDAEKVIERDRPAMFGGGKSIARGKYNLACNVRPQRQDNVITSVWNQFKP
jgi:hypothetical protein